MELVVRISRLMRELGHKYRVCYAFNANCWTEVPEDLKSLKSQRYRWQRGLVDILTFHKKMLFNPSYGRTGIVAMPYFFIFENSIRIYTLLPPEFYNALDDYNTKHPEATLWLLQEIWPEENPEGQDYLQKAYVGEYFKEIGYVLDAIHGRASIPARKGRAYGTYTRDVSKHVLGYLVGRELEPDEQTQDYSSKGVMELCDLS